jgi:hypothetical protein
VPQINTPLREDGQHEEKFSGGGQVTAPTPSTRWDAKDPLDIVDYFLDWSTLPLPAGVTITTSTVTLPPTGSQPAPIPPYSVLASLGDDFTGTIQRVRLTGGVPLGQYPIVLTIDTSDEQQFSVTKTLSVRARTR